MAVSGWDCRSQRVLSTYVGREIFVGGTVDGPEEKYLGVAANVEALDGRDENLPAAFID